MLTDLLTKLHILFCEIQRVKIFPVTRPAERQKNQGALTKESAAEIKMFRDNF